MIAHIYSQELDIIIYYNYHINIEEGFIKEM